MGREYSVAVFLAVVVGAALWIEHGNRIAIAPPQVTDYSPCADSDAMPYSAPCIDFMMGPRLHNTPDAAN
jgi:hypothetical protein